MIIKAIEIRDEATCIAAIAIRMCGANKIEDAFLHRCGFPADGREVVLMRLDDQKSTVDPYEWPNQRTMGNAHKFIRENFTELENGQVVDVRQVLGEQDYPAPAEILP